MIQFRRGKTLNWRGSDLILAPGQPGYDKDKHKIKIGDGEKHWNALPYASGLAEEDILTSEARAKIRNALDKEDKTLFTYGTETPDNKTIGQVYLQYYETEPEVDYIVDSGRNGIWTYQKWHSGVAKCFGVVELKASIQNAFEGPMLFYDNKAMKQVDYPFTFNRVPSEVATLQSPGGLVWLAGRVKNNKSKSGAYSLISPDKLDNSPYTIALQVEGRWR